MEELENKVQPGDTIFIYDTSSIISNIIARFDNGSWSHVGIYVGEGKLCEAITSGVIKRSLSVYKKPNIRIGAYRFPDMKPWQVEKLISFLEEKIGCPITTLE